MKNPWLITLAAMVSLGVASNAMATTDAAKLFKTKCAMCHAVDKKKVGPALKAMSKDASVLRKTIANGRKMMPKFGKKLSTEQIDGLVAFIQSKQ